LKIFTNIVKVPPNIGNDTFTFDPV
jgi:hypothetical protein